MTFFSPTLSMEYFHISNIVRNLVFLFNFISMKTYRVLEDEFSIHWMSHTHNIFILLFSACVWCVVLMPVEVRNYIIDLTTWFEDGKWSVLLEKSDTSIRRIPKGKGSYRKQKNIYSDFFHSFRKESNNGFWWQKVCFVWL